MLNSEVILPAVIHPIRELARTLICSALLLTACTAAGTPEAPALSSAMVVTANPHATRAGEWVLQQGGSSVDAAVAIEAVLSLVEPQSSGLGGSAS